ncbi:MAG: hypothetical protein R3E39_26635 [Anaerolineae bacterium]
MPEPWFCFLSLSVIGALRQLSLVENIVKSIFTSLTSDLEFTSCALFSLVKFIKEELLQSALSMNAVGDSSPEAFEIVIEMFLVKKSYRALDAVLLLPPSLAE